MSHRRTFEHPDLAVDRLIADIQVVAGIISLNDFLISNDKAPLGFLKP